MQLALTDSGRRPHRAAQESPGSPPDYKINYGAKTTQINPCNYFGVFLSKHHLRTRVKEPGTKIQKKLRQTAMKRTKGLHNVVDINIAKYTIND